jgi:hypothetical protein
MLLSGLSVAACSFDTDDAEDAEDDDDDDDDKA